MTISLYNVSAPMFLRGLDVLDHLLDKAAASDLSEDDLFEARLWEDMRPFPDQIRMATYSARSAVGRLSGIEWPRSDDAEATIADLKATVKLSRDFVASMTRDGIDGQEAVPVQLRFPGVELDFHGQGYLTSFALPNFYFHVTTAYAILRNRGVALGKRDYLGTLELI